MSKTCDLCKFRIRDNTILFSLIMCCMNNFAYVMILYFCQAGMRTGDRVWRMPLFQHYAKQVTESHLADVNNVSTAGRMGSACTAAAFLHVSHQVGVFSQQADCIHKSFGTRKHSASCSHTC